MSDQVLTLGPGSGFSICVPVAGDSVGPTVKAYGRIYGPTVATNIVVDLYKVVNGALIQISNDNPCVLVTEALTGCTETSPGAQPDPTPSPTPSPFPIPAPQFWRTTNVIHAFPINAPNTFNTGDKFVLMARIKNTNPPLPIATEFVPNLTKSAT
jgi:hypothetical protein